VAGDYLVTAVQHWLQQHWGMVADVMRVTSRFADLQHGYANPAQHGVDRWAALIAARSLYPTAVCVIDCGSAVTADLVDARGQHLGGRILPGLRMLRTALAHGTTQLPAVIDTPLQVVDFATSTAASIHSGTLHMLVASIDEICAAAHARVGKDCELLITGGDAELLLPLLHYPLQHQPQLVMQGMRIVADAGEC
jgi:type III pantothenate kinase